MTISAIILTNLDVDIYSWCLTLTLTFEINMWHWHLKLTFNNGNWCWHLTFIWLSFQFRSIFFMGVVANSAFSLAIISLFSHSAAYPHLSAHPRFSEKPYSFSLCYFTSIFLVLDTFLSSLYSVRELNNPEISPTHICTYTAPSRIEF